MSAPIYDFTCTACDFEGSYASGTGTRVYLVPDGSTVHVPWDTAWCPECRTIRRIQLGMSPVKLENECDRLEAALPAKPTLMVRLFGRQGDNDHTANRRERLAEIRQMLAVLGGRTSLNVCEQCGCTAVEVMHWRAAGEAPTPMGHAHPGCGGQLMITEGMRLARQYPKYPPVLRPVFADAPARCE